MGLEQEEEEGRAMTEWPDFFEVNSVERVPQFELKAKPKLNNFKSMENLLQEYNIRDHLDR